MDPLRVTGIVIGLAWMLLGASATMGEDCNGNGILDHCDLDCGEPGGPCDVPDCGLREDCNGNGIPDECELCPVDIVFIMDTSGSMRSMTEPEEDRELFVLCERIPSVAQGLGDLYVDVSYTVHGICDWVYYTVEGCEDAGEPLVDLLGDVVPGEPGDCGFDIYQTQRALRTGGRPSRWLRRSGIGLPERSASSCP